MAKAAGRPTKAKPAKAAPARGRSLIWLQGLLCGVLAAFVPGSAVLLAALLAPSLGALVFDHAPGRPLARTMLLFGLAASVQPVMALWNAGNAVDTALALVADPRTIGIAWAAAAGGWLLAELLPVAMRLAIDASSQARIARLRAMRDRCAAEWGFPALDPP